MNCVGNKKNGESCGRPSRKGFKTCGSHKKQEPETEEGSYKVEPIKPVSAAPNKNKKISFYSKYPKHLVVLRGRQRVLAPSGEIIGQTGLYAQFNDHKFETSDKETIKLLREMPIYNSEELKEA